MLEGTQHPAAFFVTLTYSEAELPAEGVLKKHVQRYLRDLRRMIAPRRVRYFCTSEYGERFGRPHYHLALYGALVPRELIESWGRGIVDVRLLGPESAAYICGYILKEPSGESTGRNPEFRLMSRRPGIGGMAIDAMARDLGRVLTAGEDVPRALRIGGRLWPAGRYVRVRLRGGAGVDDGLRRYIEDMKRAEKLLQLTPKDVEDLAKLRRVDKAKGERAQRRAEAVQRANFLRKQL